jgi:hypothetical protein
MNYSLKLIALTISLTLFGFVTGRYWSVPDMYKHHKREHEQLIGDRESFIETKNSMISGMIAEGEYKCCLEKPCVYCIEKTPGHGEGATCSCLEDIVNGVHPCGECIGEILEGHGNRFLAKYFASSIAEEVGEEHLNSLKIIVANKYNISIEEQM